MIVKLIVKLVRGPYAEGDWSADIELDESSSLEDLHSAIQAAVEFANDHPYSFFVARTDRRGHREYFHDDEESVDTTTVQDLYPLPKDRYLFYLFDWRYEWVFKISPSRKRPHEPVKGVRYPKVVSETGTKPTQYRSYNEDEDEDE